MRASSAAPIRWWVSGDNGVWIDTKSAWASNSSRGSKTAPFFRGHAGRYQRVGGDDAEADPQRLLRQALPDKAEADAPQHLLAEATDRRIRRMAPRRRRAPRPMGHARTPV